MLDVVDYAKSKFLGLCVDDHQEGVVDDLGLCKAQGVVVDADVQDLVHLVAHRQGSGTHLVDEVVVVIYTILLGGVSNPVQSLIEVKQVRILLLHHAFTDSSVCSCCSAGCALVFLLFSFFLLILDETVQGRALQVVPDQVLLICLSQAIVEVLADKDVLLDGFTVLTLSMLALNKLILTALDILSLIIRIYDACSLFLPGLLVTGWSSD